MAYLFRQATPKTAQLAQRIVATAVVVVGATMQLNMVWDTADVLMGLMALINVPVLVILLKPALRCLDNFIQQKREGKDPVYRAADVGLKEKTDFWQ